MNDAHGTEGKHAPNNAEKDDGGVDIGRMPDIRGRMYISGIKETKSTLKARKRRQIRISLK